MKYLVPVLIHIEVEADGPAMAVRRARRLLTERVEGQSLSVVGSRGLAHARVAEGSEIAGDLWDKADGRDT